MPQELAFSLARIVGVKGLSNGRRRPLFFSWLVCAHAVLGMVTTITRDYVGKVSAPGI